MKTIKVIDLFILLANKEYDKIPRKIKNGSSQLQLYKNNNDYYQDEENVATQIFYLGNCHLNEEIEIIEDILDETEKEYLSHVIRPFRDRIKYITKTKGDFNSLEYILIESDYIDDNDTCFPSFEAGTMYKGMELDTSYSLEELGL